MNFDINKNDMKLISQIGERLKPIYAKQNINFIKQDFEMDMIACHLNGCKLDLDKLLNAENFTFNHDVAGIRNNLNRETGELDNFFVPRCAA